MLNATETTAQHPAFQAAWHKVTLASDADKLRALQEAAIQTVATSMGDLGVHPHIIEAVRRFASGVAAPAEKSERDFGRLAPAIANGEIFKSDATDVLREAALSSGVDSRFRPLRNRTCDQDGSGGPIPTLLAPTARKVETIHKALCPETHGGASGPLGVALDLLAVDGARR